MNLWKTLREPARSSNYVTSGYTLSDYVTWIVNGNTYHGMSQTLQGRHEPIENDFEGIVSGAYKRDGVVFAVELTRLMLFSEARFQWQRMENGRPGDLFGTPDLGIIEKPWPNGTTGDLLTRMLGDADMAGNNYLTRSVRTNGRIRRLRPDRTVIVLGSNDDADHPEDALDCEVVGYITERKSTGKSEFLPADEVAHFAPIPDPIANFRGMSWLTPVLREVMGDKAATEHKLKFFENGATPNLVIKMDPALTPEQVGEYADLMEQNNEGVRNAYKTLFLGGGQDVTVVGADLKQIDFKATQGAGETRIAAAGGVHPVIVGLSEGLAGSSLNAGNFASARRLLADKTMRPLWRNAAGSLETIVPAPSAARLWVDTRDIAFLREDEKDAAEIMKEKALTIEAFVRAGYTPESAAAAVQSGDLALLKHTGLYSVQLQPPGAQQKPPERAHAVERDEEGRIVGLRSIG